MFILRLHLGVVAIEKGSFGLLSTKVANFTYFKVNEHSIDGSYNTLSESPNGEVRAPQRGVSWI